MKKTWPLLAAAILYAGLLSACGAASDSNQASGSEKKEIKIGATAGPYSDQVEWGIKPILEQKGYKVSIIEFNDYIQPNLALADGSLDANVFQHIIYLQSFAEDRKLDLIDLIKVPTAPIGIYSKKHQSLDEVEEGSKVALPNDPTNQARALVMMQQFGWLKLKDDIDPIQVSEKDVAENIKNIELLPIEAAQLPRSLEDADYSFINGNFALASGLKLTEALALEETPDQYMNLVAVKTADKDKQFVKDLVEAYQSEEFKKVTETRFEGFVKPDYQK
ncbi:ABC transporter substrate-binding protein [Paenibacillus sp. 32O-W]|uniref:MetQ/NlpA family ABC transporter substrate-binding protein n=1 Tax=Paenibacillus sp. 32O-W TaxID=1695218 RepID=UPI00071EF5A0|nr:MetQ/NlpA family ABC transporter substrate-binding protein [Paenibacillus sp. 32O-W]ALS27885.1 ABC transporter substrate-binding protein [Paenibacillus sp. 32O-W]